ncbi:MAG TPA: DUF3108 domain-containing protein [Rhodanobacteraceae bacterium]|nr:DUF3108 domain-containing protein [Rhodanobacteraceae bacterium]
MNVTRIFMAAAACALAVCASARTAAQANAPLSPFTARYAVSKDGKRIGEATLSLQRAGDVWLYQTRIRGTSGLASLLNVSLDETSAFRWQGDSPMLVTYDYDLDSLMHSRQRHVRARGGEVHVRDGKHDYRYPAAAGMVERHSAVLAIAAELRHGATRFTLPVATRKRIEQQQFEVTGHDTVQVPAGQFEATRVVRTDDNHGIRAWYASTGCATPVKLAQGSSGLVLSLLTCSERR